jgi:hypothetical protein
MTLAKSDRDFVFKIIDQFDEYEAANTSDEEE